MNNIHPVVALPGSILSVHIMINKNTGLSRGFGFVSFTTEEVIFV